MLIFARELHFILKIYNKTKTPVRNNRRFCHFIEISIAMNKHKSVKTYMYQWGKVEDEPLGMGKEVEDIPEEPCK
jgi:hypothetical protein